MEYTPATSLAREIFADVTDYSEEYRPNRTIDFELSLCNQIDNWDIAQCKAYLDKHFDDWDEEDRDAFFDAERFEVHNWRQACREVSPPLRVIAVTTYLASWLKQVGEYTVDDEGDQLWMFTERVEPEKSKAFEKILALQEQTR